MTAIIKKEMRTYFNSMIGYVFLAFLVFVTAIFFAAYNLLSLSADYSGVLASTAIIFIIIIPMLTMRLFAEETKQKTDQLLFTAPVTVWQIVLGKYFAALLLFLTGMAITLTFPLSIAGFGELPVAQITGAFVGYILLGACFISVGLFISVLTDNQIVSAVVTFSILFFFFIVDALSNALPRDRLSSMIFVMVLVIAAAYFLYDSTKSLLAALILAAFGSGVTGGLYMTLPSLFDALILRVVGWFSLMLRFGNFHRGILHTADIVYYLSFSIAFIALTINVIEKRRWR